jgi:hypothetical protein
MKCGSMSFDKVFGGATDGGAREMVPTFSEQYMEVIAEELNHSSPLLNEYVEALRAAVDRRKR